MPFLPPSNAVPPLRRAGWSTAAKLLALFLLILGAKFCVMRACSCALPFFDQWDGEGRNLIQPWLYGTLRWTDLVAVHVQHRIALTRLLVLGLFQANGGQWDTQVEMIAAAMIHAGCAVVIAAVLMRRLGPRAENKIVLALTALFALPFDWENTLSGGFQSPFYFLLLLSVVTIWGLGTQRPRTAGWWTGVGAAALSWGSMASAPLTPLAVALAVALRRWRPGPEDTPPAEASGDWLTLGTALALFAAGASLSIGVNPVTHLQPKTAADFVEKFLALLGWPNPTPWAAPLAYAPWVFLVARRIVHPGQASGAADRFLLPLGMFAVLQTATIAYGRNQFHVLLVSRYMDVLSIGALVNAACLIQFSGEARTARGRAWLAATGAGWFALWCFGLAAQTVTALDRNLPSVKLHNAAEEVNVAALVEHPDLSQFEGKSPLDYQCDKPALLIDLLGDARLRGALPSRTRLPIALRPLQMAGTVQPIVEDKPGAAAPVGWSLEPPPAGVRASVFRSQTIDRALPYLEFGVSGEVGAQTRFGLVGERTGHTVWITPEETGTNDGGEWRAVLARTPAEPFHVEAAVYAGGGRLRFLYPRESGWLTVWVRPVFDAAVGLVFAGLALWLGAVFAEAARGGPSAPVEVETPRLVPFVRREDESPVPVLN